MDKQYKLSEQVLSFLYSFMINNGHSPQSIELSKKTYDEYSLELSGAVHGLSIIVAFNGIAVVSNTAMPDDRVRLCYLGTYVEYPIMRPLVFSMEPGDNTDIAPTCQCGKEKHNFATHSRWCPKYV